MDLCTGDGSGVFGNDVESLHYICDKHFFWKLGLLKILRDYSNNVAIEY